MIQLDLFEDNQLILILKELRKVKESSEAVRRGVFRRVAELEQKLREMEMAKEKTG